MAAIERFDQFPPDFEKVIQPIPDEENYIWPPEHERGEVILANVITQFRQKVRGEVLTEELKKATFREIVLALAEEERKILLETLEREL